MRVIEPTASISSICFPTRRMSRRSRYSSSSEAFGGLQEPFEQRTELARAPEVFGMPLDAEAEPGGWILHCLDDAVWRGRRHDEAARHLLHGLMVTAVHFACVGVAQP